MHLFSLPPSRWPWYFHAVAACLTMAVMMGMAGLLAYAITDKANKQRQDLRALETRLQIRLQDEQKQSPVNFIQTLPLASSADDVVRDMGQHAQALRIQMASLSIAVADPSPGLIRKIQFNLSANGEYASMKEWLAAMLGRYLRFNKLVEELRTKVISASIYPALVTTLGLAISLFLLLVVMPNFSGMYENLRGGSTGTTALTIEISQFIGKNRVLFLGGLLFTALLLAYGIVSGHAKRLVVKAARSIPSVQRRVEDFQLAMMYQALALLLKGGYPMTDAMAVASQSALSPELKSALAQALAQIERGGLVSQALSQAHLCEEVGRRLMAAAERNGDFHLAADVVSRIHGERFELFVERTTRIIEPLLLLAVALMVGTIVVMMYLPVFDMATSLR